MSIRRQIGAALMVALVAMLVRPGLSSADSEPPRQSVAEVLERWWTRVMAELEAASAALEPKRTPPAPVKVRWAASRIGPIDLKAPLLAIEIADVDGDGKAAELIALTTREVAVLTLQVRQYRRGGRTITRRSWLVGPRHSLPSEPAEIAPRDPVGALIVADMDGDGKAEILARSSTQAKGIVVQWRNGALVELSRFDGFPICAAVRAHLMAGRNYFLPSTMVWPADVTRPVMPKWFYSARCAAGMVDGDGRPLAAFGVAATNGSLAVRYDKTCGRRDATCQTKPTSEVRVGGVGTAWAVADVDNDGVPEVITSGVGAPGMKDRVTVYSGARSLKRIYWRNFVGGVVGIAAGDVDGDGRRDVIAVVRLLGATMVESWSLN